jgi:hypothetical protein
MRLTIKERKESMATGKALDGKPYAGNPHVRFDEGEVAPAATPRRGSLLYNIGKRNIGKRIAAAAIAAADGRTAESAPPAGKSTEKRRNCYGSETK